ncbi:MAG: DedA family protein [Candidatus Micrarchaeota archaeon]|nr:DedA family protein [Candidatus Micrarchaeota archaeon]
MEFLLVGLVASLLELFTDASAAIGTFVTSYGYYAVFILMTLEYASLPIPSEIVLPLIGFFAASGTFSFPVALGVVLVAGVVGMFIDYYIAYFLGKEVVYKHASLFHISRRRIETFDEAFKRNGEFAVFIARLIPIARALISFPAGFAGMQKRKFLLYSLAGSFIWDVVLMLFGYYGLASSSAGTVLAGIGLFSVVIYIVYKKGIASMKRIEPSPPQGKP